MAVFCEYQYQILFSLSPLQYVHPPFLLHMASIHTWHTDIRAWGIKVLALSIDNRVQRQ